jgi:phosphoribosyl-ATP pyrophosphohydrolase
MAQYTTKRKYTKKPTTKLKKVVKKVKKETVEVVQAVAEVPVVKSFRQKCIDWVKGLVE